MKNKTADLSMVRTINSEMIWDYLYKTDSATIPMISEATGLSLPTVTRAIEHGRIKGFIINSSIADSTGGRKAQLYGIYANFLYFISILLDNEDIFYTIRNLKGQYIEKGSLNIERNNLLSQIKNFILQKKAAYPQLNGASIALPGIISRGNLILSWQFGELNGINLAEYFESECGINIVIENNLRACAKGIRRYCNNYDTGVNIAFEFGHSGFGMGLVINGEVFSGSNGAAGEIGMAKISNSEKYLGYNSYVDSFNGAIAFHSKNLTSIIAILNPSNIVIYPPSDDFPTDIMIDEVKKDIIEHIMPKFVISWDFIEDSLDGLYEIIISLTKKSLVK